MFFARLIRAVRPRPPVPAEAGPAAVAKRGRVTWHIYDGQPVSATLRLEPVDAPAVHLELPAAVAYALARDLSFDSAMEAAAGEFARGELERLRARRAGAAGETRPAKIAAAPRGGRADRP